jgi:histone deacetylase HOS3
VQAASTSIHGPHGQYIENIHLEPYENEQQFWDILYRGSYSKLLGKAHAFLQATGAIPEKTLVIIRYYKLVIRISSLLGRLAKFAN